VANKTQVVVQNLAGSLSGPLGDSVGISSLTVVSGQAISQVRNQPDQESGEPGGPTDPRPPETQRMLELLQWQHDYEDHPESIFLFSEQYEIDAQWGTNHNDSLQGADRRSNLLFGGVGNDTLKGSDRNTNEVDILVGGRGSDTLKGSVGIDLFVFNLQPNTGPISIQSNPSTNSSSSTPSLTSFSVTIAAETDSIHNFNQVEEDALVLNGTSGNDTIQGSNYNNILIGNGGKDTLLAGNYGINILVGGSGADHFVAGKSRDFIIYTDPVQKIEHQADGSIKVTVNSGEIDFIKDFNSSQDLILATVLGSTSSGISIKSLDEFSLGNRGDQTDSIPKLVGTVIKKLLTFPFIPGTDRIGSPSAGSPPIILNPTPRKTLALGSSGMPQTSTAGLGGNITLTTSPLLIVSPSSLQAISLLPPSV
jgi:hypothetical protein